HGTAPMSAEADRPGDTPPRPPPSPDRFRWQALFQRSEDPLFVLNRRLRLLFVNRALEVASGLSAAEAFNLSCTGAPAPAGKPLPEARAHALCPPPEVLTGQAARARRLLPGRRGWEVEFTPIRAGGKLLAVLGRVVVLPAEATADPAPLPESVANL